MSSNEAWLALYFDAPLLSFGGECKFDRRETLSFPSRSAVTGLVAAALGVARDDRPALARLAQLRLESVAFREKMGVLLEDYHTAGGGYPGNSADIPVSASRKSHPVVTQRHYFADGKSLPVLPAFWRRSGRRCAIRSGGAGSAGSTVFRRLRFSRESFPPNRRRWRNCRRWRKDPNCGFMRSARWKLPAQCSIRIFRWTSPPGSFVRAPLWSVDR